MQSKSDNMPSKGNSSSRGRGNFRGRGRGNDNRNYQLRFCKTEISRKSDEIESIYQSKSESPLIADKGDEEGVCYFLRSRLPTAQGTVNVKKVITLRDTGCTGCVVRRSLVSSDQLLGKESDVTLIDESTQRYPLAMVEIDCPFFTGKTEALCMDDTLYDLVIGNIDGSKHVRIYPIFQLRQLLGLKLIRKRLTGNLMSLIRLLARIKRHLNRLKILTPN